MLRNLKLIEREAFERLMAYYWSHAAKYLFTLGSIDGETYLPLFVLKNSNDLQVNSDGSVSWEAREIGLGLHSFIELTTGVKQRNRVYLPLCLVNPKTRRGFGLLAYTTIDPADGRFNTKEAEALVSLRDGKTVKIQLKLESLASHYAMLKLMPPEIAYRMRSRYCVFCRDLPERRVEF